MGKTIRNEFYKHLTFEKLLAAHKRTMQGKWRAKDAVRFDLNYAEEVGKLLKELRYGKYQVGKYYSFVVTDPKEREILALPYRDRVAQQWLVAEVLEPFFVPRFIRQTYACLKGRGTHAAATQLQRYMRAAPEDAYVLKMDVAKFFYSIDKDLLMGFLREKVGDKRIIGLLRQYVYGDGNKAGIPIGCLTSQYFANIYLDRMDWFAKSLGVKYVRYMDDFVMVAEDAGKAREVKGVLTDFMETALKLRLNPKSRYFPAKDGVDFVGYRIFRGYRLLRLRSKRSLRRTLEDYVRDGDAERLVQRIHSWRGHAEHCDSYRYTVRALTIGGVT
jgi:retron-type reverse transcriptase